MANINDLRSPLTQSMNRGDLEQGDLEQATNAQNIQEEYEQHVEIKRARNLAKCFRFFAIVFILGFMSWVISLIVRHKYIVEKPNNHDRFNQSKISGSEYIKYFAKSGENPMHCRGMYCWPWQTPSRVVCSVENNARPWDSEAAWMCEAMCPNNYDLDTVSITCSQDQTIVTNPHLGCSLVYSMKYNSFISDTDWEELGFFITMLFLCVICLVFIGVCASASPPPHYSSSYTRSSGPDTCDILIWAALLNTRSSKGHYSSGHSSRMWG